LHVPRLGSTVRERISESAFRCFSCATPDLASSRSRRAPALARNAKAYKYASGTMVHPPSI